MDSNVQEFTGLCSVFEVSAALPMSRQRQTDICYSLQNRHPAALAIDVVGNNLKNLWYTFSNQSDIYFIAYAKKKTRQDFSVSVFAQVLAKMALKTSPSFSFPRILAGFVVKVDDFFFFIQSIYKLKTMLFSPGKKRNKNKTHRHLNFILVSMNDCACASL